MVFTVSASLIHKQLNENLGVKSFALHDYTECNAMKFYTFKKSEIKYLSMKFSHIRKVKYFSDGLNNNLEVFHTHSNVC